MAYMSQERKAGLVAACKVALARWLGVKWTVSVRNKSTIVLTVSKGDIDFRNSALKDIDRMLPYGEPKWCCDVNVYHIDRDWTGPALEFLTAARDALNIGNHDRSDLMTDYFDVGWYVDIQIGKHDRPYVYTGVVNVGQQV